MKDISNLIQYATGYSLKEIAEDINYERPYLNDQINKGVNEGIYKILHKKYEKIIIEKLKEAYREWVEPGSSVNSHPQDQIHQPAPEPNPAGKEELKLSAHKNASKNRDRSVGKSDIRKARSILKSNSGPKKGRQSRRPRS